MPGPSNVQTWRYAPAAYVILLVCWAIYAAASILAPHTTATTAFQLSGSERFLLQLTIIVPILVIWLVALQGALTFKRYAKLIKGSSDAPALNMIATGLLWLVGYLVVGALLGTTVQYFADSPYLNTMVALQNHLPVFASVIAFLLLCRGSYRLRIAADFRIWTSATIGLLIAFSVFAGVMAWAFATNEIVPNRNGIPTYSWPRDVMIFSFLLPYVLAWFMGLLAAMNIARYSRNVKGIIYRQALRRLVWGLVTVVSFAALIQALSLISRIFSSATLPSLLTIIYGLLVLYGLGFWLVRSGAKKLTQIEVVQ